MLRTTSTESPHGTGPQPRVLVVEDDPNLSDVVARYLARSGMAVEVVADGLAGLERALTTLPDLIVLDLMLPGLDGIELFRRLRRAAPIPVVMLTARWLRGRSGCRARARGRRLRRKAVLPA